jgi:Aspartyl protease
MRVPCLLAVLLLSCTFAAASSSVPLPFRLTPQGGILVPVIVNGTEPSVFLLDTGSSGSVISDELATRIGATVVAKRTMTTAAGEKDAFIARIEHLGMGGVTARDVLATIVPAADFDLPDLESKRRHVQGVIGQDVLAALRYTIDYRKCRVVWHDTAAGVPRNAAVLELEPHDNRFLVVLPQDRRMLRLVPDTGTEALVLFQVHDRSEPGVTLARESVGLTSLAGSRPARLAVVDALRIGSRTLMNVAALVVGREEGSPAADGLLPLHIFARVTFNGPERQLFIED